MRNLSGLESLHSWFAAGLFLKIVGRLHSRAGLQPDSATFRETLPVDGAGKSARPMFVDASATFWGSFGDATLDERIALSTTANQSVARADANYRAAQATVRVSRSALFSTFGVSAGESRSRSAQSGTRAASVENGHSVQLESSWEPDLRGNVRRSIEAADATAQSSAANLAAVRLLIQSEIATDYLALRSADETSDLLARSVASHETALRLTQSQFKAGTVSRSDVALATAQLKSIQTQLTDVVATRAQLKHAIAVLAGKTPAAYTLAKATLNVTLPAPPFGLPSQLLERSPDIAPASQSGEVQ